MAICVHQQAQSKQGPPGSAWVWYKVQQPWVVSWTLRLAWAQSSMSWTQMSFWQGVLGQTYGGLGDWGKDLMSLRNVQRLQSTHRHIPLRISSLSSKENRALGSWRTSRGSLLLPWAAPLIGGGRWLQTFTSVVQRCLTQTHHQQQKATVSPPCPASWGLKLWQMHTSKGKSHYIPLLRTHGTRHQAALSWQLVKETTQPLLQRQLSAVPRHGLSLAAITGGFAYAK